MKNSIKIIYLLFVALLASWLIPSAVRFITYSYDRFPMIHYSSIAKRFMMTVNEGKGKTQYKDVNGNKYTEKSYYALQPMLFYRQLIMDGNLPDSVDGVSISPEFIGKHTFTFRYKPEEKNAAGIALYPMYESESGKVNLSDPTDMFRLRNTFAFIESADNKINKSKSALFDQALKQKGFSYPAQWAVGIPYAKKPFDDGYFSLDSQGKLFQIKLARGNAVVNDTRASQRIKVKYMMPISVKDHTLLGFVVSEDNALYALFNKNFGLRKVLEHFDVDKDKLSIFANPLYWTLWVDNQNGRTAYALDARSFTLVDHYQLHPKTKVWEQLHGWIFPFRLTFKNPNSGFIAPRLIDFSAKNLLLNLLLVIVLLGVYRRRCDSRYLTFTSVLIAIFGIFGFIAALCNTDRNLKSIDYI